MKYVFLRIFILFLIQFFVIHGIMLFDYLLVILGFESKLVFFFTYGFTVFGSFLYWFLFVFKFKGEENKR